MTDSAPALPAHICLAWWNLPGKTLQLIL